MRRCPVCGHQLPEGVEYCQPRDSMRNNRGSKTIKFGGCYPIRMEAVFRGQSRAGKHSSGIRALTDHQRSRAVYGKDCILSPFGPLPTESEIRIAPAEESLWGSYDHPDVNFTSYPVTFSRDNGWSIYD